MGPPVHEVHHVISWGLGLSFSSKRPCIFARCCSQVDQTLSACTRGSSRLRAAEQAGCHSGTPFRTHKACRLVRSIQAQGQPFAVPKPAAATSTLHTAAALCGARDAGVCWRLITAVAGWGLAVDVAAAGSCTAAGAATSQQLLPGIPAIRNSHQTLCRVPLAIQL
jgi:hypothetical protein